MFVIGILVFQVLVRICTNRIRVVWIQHIRILACQIPVTVSNDIVDVVGIVDKVDVVDVVDIVDFVDIVDMADVVDIVDLVDIVDRNVPKNQCQNHFYMR